MYVFEIITKWDISGTLKSISSVEKKIKKKALLSFSVYWNLNAKLWNSRKM